MRRHSFVYYDLAPALSLKYWGWFFFSKRWSLVSVRVTRVLEYYDIRGPNLERALIRKWYDLTLDFVILHVLASWEFLKPARISTSPPAQHIAFSSHFIYPYLHCQGEQTIRCTSGNQTFPIWKSIGTLVWTTRWSHDMFWSRFTPTSLYTCSRCGWRMTLPPAVSLLSPLTLVRKGRILYNTHRSLTHPVLMNSGAGRLHSQVFSSWSSMFSLFYGTIQHWIKIARGGCIWVGLLGCSFTKLSTHVMEPRRDEPDKVVRWGSCLIMVCFTTSNVDGPWPLNRLKFSLMSWNGRSWRDKHNPRSHHLRWCNQPWSILVDIAYIVRIFMRVLPNYLGGIPYRDTVSRNCVWSCGGRVDALYPLRAHRDYRW